MVSEGKPQCELHYAGVTRERGNAGDTTAGDVAVGLTELWRIGHIENLPSRFDVPALANWEFAENRGIEDIDVRSAKRVPTDIAYRTHRGGGICIG